MTRVGGLGSHRATTSRIAEVPLSRSGPAWKQQGWDPDAAGAAGEARELAALVTDWPVGTVVERRLDGLWVRAFADTT
ncbi:DUF7715 family protein [Pseudonocardia sichuanensis]